MALARTAFFLTTLVVLLARGLRLSPDDLVAAGMSGLAVYALLALGGPLVQRLARTPGRPAPPRGEAGSQAD